MGVDPDRLRADEGGDHVSPEVFHGLVSKHLGGAGESCDRMGKGVSARVCARTLVAYMLIECWRLCKERVGYCIRSSFSIVAVRVRAGWYVADCVIAVPLVLEQMRTS